MSLPALWPLVSATVYIALLRVGVDKSLARPTSRYRRTESRCRWREGSVHVPNCKSFLVTETERKHVMRLARFYQHRDASCHQVFFFLQGKARKGIHAILKETSYDTTKNWVSQFKRGDFPSVMHLSWTTQTTDHSGDYWLNSRTNFGRSLDLC